MELRIVNPADDSSVAPGERGEIRVRGVNLFNGYHGMEEETASAFDRDGWFKTGDLGRIDERGMLFFEGRYKRMVKSGGENVSEREVECFLEDRIPGVNIAQVVGVPDPVWGEAVIAFVEPLAGASLGEADVRRRCKEEIADFKVPKRVFLVSDREWPRNEVGKISKDALVAMALERLGRSPAS
jgi:fatty-acyl-CoA synthase